MFGKKIEVMCEIASNHHGSLDRLTVLTDYVARENLATYLKVQVWSARNLYSESSSKYSSFKKLELPDEDWLQYFSYFPSNQMQLVVEPFDNRIFDFVLPQFKIPICKVPPSRILDHAFLKRLADSDMVSVFFLGVSGAYEGEIERALDILGDRCKKLIFGYQNFPSSVDAVNFRKINRLIERFGLEVGYADHSGTTDIKSFAAVIAALANGANLIEKHICLSHLNGEIDNVSALTPDEFKIFSEQIRFFNRGFIFQNDLNLSQEELNYRSQMFCFPKSFEKLSETKARATVGTRFFRDSCNDSSKTNEFV